MKITDLDIDTEVIEEIVTLNMDLETLRSLRDNIRGYIGQADAKALGIVTAYPYEGRVKQELYKLYLDAISPKLEYPEAPKGYKIMDCRTIEHMEHEIKVCRDILFKKYEIINKMIECIRM